MTRSAEEAIDEAQAKLGERCERLLASSARVEPANRAHKHATTACLREGVRLDLQSAVAI
jgi:hypothetical protein